MKLNPECIRCVLKYCVENIDYKEIGLGDRTCRCVSLDELYELKESSFCPCAFITRLTDGGKIFFETTLLIS